MEPIADLIDDVFIRCFAWRHAILGLFALISLVPVLITRLITRHKRHKHPFLITSPRTPVMGNFSTD